MPFHHRLAETAPILTHFIGADDRGGRGGGRSGVALGASSPAAESPRPADRGGSPRAGHGHGSGWRRHPDTPTPRHPDTPTPRHPDTPTQPHARRPGGTWRHGNTPPIPRKRPSARPPEPDNIPPIPANFRAAAAGPAAHADTLGDIPPSDFSGEHA
ncbi:hypothetical protein F9948_30675 [Burkholderia thailandensis]|nr:hypothetical protein A8H32_02480 [Burkholderia thailandensis]MDD1484426.1 hypothetical protein [Burkholderia thailandensis]